MVTRTCIHCRHVLTPDDFDYLAGGYEMRKANICKDCMPYAVQPTERLASKPIRPLAEYVKLNQEL